MVRGLRLLAAWEYRLEAEAVEDPEKEDIQYELSRRELTVPGSSSEDETVQNSSGHEPRSSDRLATIVLIRHGESEANAYRLGDGEYPFADAPLTLKGRTQACALAREASQKCTNKSSDEDQRDGHCCWAEDIVQRVVCSPMARALQTAIRVFPAKDITALPCLTEFYPDDPSNVPRPFVQLLELLQVEQAERCCATDRVDLDRCTVMDHSVRKDGSSASTDDEIEVIDGESADDDSFEVSFGTLSNNSSSGIPQKLDVLSQAPSWWSRDFCEDEGRLSELFAYICAAPERRIGVVCHYGVIAQICRQLGMHAYMHPHNCSPVELLVERVSPSTQRQVSRHWVALQPLDASFEEIGLLGDVEAVEATLGHLMLSQNDSSSSLSPARAAMQVVLFSADLTGDGAALLRATVETAGRMLQLSGRGDPERRSWRLSECERVHRHDDVRVSFVSKVNDPVVLELAQLLRKNVGIAEQPAFDETSELCWFDFSKEIFRAVEGSGMYPNLAAFVEEQHTLGSDGKAFTGQADGSVWQDALDRVRWQLCWGDGTRSHSIPL